MYCYLVYKRDDSRLSSYERFCTKKEAFKELKKQQKEFEKQQKLEKETLRKNKILTNYEKLIEEIKSTKDKQANEAQSNLL